MADLERAAALLKSWDKILVLSHRSPDGDTLGCASALCRALASLGKSVQFRCADAVPEKFGYLFRGIVFAEFEPERIVTIDVADKALLGALEPLGERADLAIDHHATHRPFAREAWVEGGAAEPANATEICAQFGGGGHRGAAGCTIHAPLEAVKAQIVEACGRALEGLTPPGPML